MSVARAEAEVSGLSGHRERFTEVLRGQAWWSGPRDDQGQVELLARGEERRIGSVTRGAELDKF